MPVKSAFKPKDKPLPVAPSKSKNPDDMIEGAVASLPWDKLNDSQKIERSREVIHQVLQMNQHLNERISRLEHQIRRHNHLDGRVVIPIFQDNPMACRRMKEEGLPWF